MINVILYVKIYNETLKFQVFDVAFLILLDVLIKRHIPWSQVPDHIHIRVSGYFGDFNVSLIYEFGFLVPNDYFNS